MTEPSMIDADKIAEQARRDRERFDAFLHGYVHGAQDMDADVTYDRDEFADRVRELYRQEYPEGWI